MLAEARTAVAGEPEPAAYRLSATDWALRAGVALVFSIFALEKLVGSSWVSLFAAIGYGQGFRYVTGAIQLGGSILLIVAHCMTAAMSDRSVELSVVSLIGARSACYDYVFLTRGGAVR